MIGNREHARSRSLVGWDRADVLGHHGHNRGARVMRRQVKRRHRRAFRRELARDLAREADM